MLIKLLYPLPRRSPDHALGIYSSGSSTAGIDANGELYITRSPAPHPDATSTHCPVDAKHPELRFRAKLTGGVSELELTLV
jgi:hypothetical protein